MVYIYLHLVFLGVNVGKYIPYIEHLGMIFHFLKLQSFLCEDPGTNELIVKRLIAQEREAWEKNHRETPHGGPQNPSSPRP